MDQVTYIMAVHFKSCRRGSSNIEICASVVNMPLTTYTSHHQRDVPPLCLRTFVGDIIIDDYVFLPPIFPVHYTASVAFSLLWLPQY